MVIGKVASKIAQGHVPLSTEVNKIKARAMCGIQPLKHVNRA